MAGSWLLMADAAYEEPPTDLGEGDWRARLTAWAAGVLGMLRRHPWFREIPIGGPPMGPGNLTWLDRALAAMDGTGLDEGEKVAVVMGLLPLVHGQARLTADLESGFAADPAAFERGYGATLGALIDPARFPALSRAVASGVFDEPPPGDADEFGGELDAGFLFALNCFLDGVEAFMARATTARPGSAAADPSTG